MKKTNSTSVDDYIAAFPAATQQLLKRMRSIIRKTAPDAVESISYGMPAYKNNGKPLVYYAGYEQHIGFYATPTGHAAFKKDLSRYKQGKGSVQFPLEEKLPVELIERMVKFRLEETDTKKTTSAKKQKVKKAGTDEEAVTSYMKQLKHELKDEVEVLRQLIRKTSTTLHERIKWNAPSYYTTADIFTFNLSNPSLIRLIFHHPTIVKINSPLLEGNYKDRRIIIFKSAKEITAAKKELCRIIKLQLELV
ncbi:MAG: hypothetical protein HEQ40_03080 [Lacibacter sp.]|jgi:uncharacterized protein YdhG (YjbR/CyaY superfamily)